MPTRSCKICGCPSIITVSAKCDDRCEVKYNDTEYIGSVPLAIGIGAGDYIRFSYCHVCFHIAEQNPITIQTIEHALSGD